MSFSAIFAQERAVRVIRGLLGSRRLPPALLFSGPPGVGKKMAALELAKALDCEAQGEEACDACPSCLQADKGIDPDIQLIDAEYQARLEIKDEDATEKELGDFIGKQKLIHIDTIRHAVGSLARSSLLGGWKTAVLENAHLLKTEAANAMLKSLEEPPPRTLWILVTHQDERLLPTIRSRCHRIRFGPLPPAAVRKILLSKSQEGPAASKAAEDSGGSMERALALLERRCPDPEEWLSDSLAPFRLADSLPRELHLARPLVEEHLVRMATHLRGRYASSAVRSALRELSGLRRALASNVDPRLTLEIAAFTLQAASGKPKES
jgi:DNA polymerase-3 subunit delta'